MLVFGYPHLSTPKFRHIRAIEDIATSKNDEIVWFYAREDREFALLKHCVRCEIACAVRVEEILDFVLCASLKPTYLIIESTPTIYQGIAENYMLDSKVLCVITHKEQIATLAQEGVDGVVFSSWLV
ncbi:hypothetical protein [uncultured Helicobacter sp.]|uniref:hypothetical protein n=1 Tax=uncultured Helicobacter sp. TaxID=175537 RepID=UPI001C39A7EA|nr:hypothetical protein [Candidatus Helicobacter avicola]